MKRYALLFPIAAFCAYQFLFVRKNKFSERKELKMLCRPFEMFIMGPLISNRIRKNYAAVIYKQETEETHLVKKSLSKLIEANYLGKVVLGPDIQVKVLHEDSTVGLWMNLDQTLFITIAALKLSDMDEAKLSLLVSHELAHYLSDH